MKLKKEKFHYMIIGNKSNDSVAAIGKSTIKESEYEKLLGVTFDKSRASQKMYKIYAKRHIKITCASPTIYLYRSYYIKTTNGCIY